jgi:hypothetical protein
MTPEERFTRIENFLVTVAEFHARQAEIQTRHDAEIERNNAAIDKHNAVIDKHNAAIRDLVVISRTLIDSHKRIEADIDKLREAQQATDEKLHILVETVDRIIRNK